MFLQNSHIFLSKKSYMFPFVNNSVFTYDHFLQMHVLIGFFSRIFFFIPLSFMNLRWSRYKFNNRCFSFFYRWHGTVQLVNWAIHKTGVWRGYITKLFRFREHRLQWIVFREHGTSSKETSENYYACLRGMRKEFLETRQP